MMLEMKGRANLGGNLLTRIDYVLSKLESSDTDCFMRGVQECERLFLMGAGRSGLVGRFFAMRMMHLGKDVYVAGETNTPRIGEGDLLLMVSASAVSPVLLHATRTAQAHGASVALVTQMRPEQKRELPEMVDCCVTLERRSSPQERWGYAVVDRRQRENVKPYPMGSLFECSVLVFLESVVSSFILSQQVPEEQLLRRHTVLE